MEYNVFLMLGDRRSVTEPQTQQLLINHFHSLILLKFESFILLLFKSDNLKVVILQAK